MSIHEDRELRDIKRKVDEMSNAIQDIAADVAKIADAVPQLAQIIEAKDTENTELRAKIDSGEVVDPAEVAQVKASLDEAVTSIEALLPARAPEPTGPVFTLTAGDSVPAEASLAGFETVPAEGEPEPLYYSAGGEVEGLVAYTGEVKQSA
jgi:regulator of replication initiation timing